MTKTFQSLIALACIVIIAAGSLWMLDRHQGIARKNAADHAQGAAMLSAVDARARARVAACRSDLAVYDDGSILPFVVRAGGGDILAEVAECRKTVERGY